MNTRVLVLLSHPRQFLELKGLADPFEFIPCFSLSALAERFKAGPPQAVLVHWPHTASGDLPPSRFIAELQATFANLPLYGLLDEQCPPPLEKLARQAFDDCLELPFDRVSLCRLLNGPQTIGSAAPQQARPFPRRALLGRTKSLITYEPDWFNFIDEVQIAVRHREAVLISGETGSGKTYLAQLLHELSDREHEPFCTVDCGATPPDLMAAELYGSVTVQPESDALGERAGKLAAAGGGTLFLKRFHVLRRDQQALLLRVIDTNEFEPLYGRSTRRSHARILVSSEYHLDELKQSRHISNALYYRLNQFHLPLRPLRQRRHDIEHLACHFVEEQSGAQGMLPPRIAAKFLQALQAYFWPGNIRELKSVVRRAVLRCQRGLLTSRDLPEALLKIAELDFENEYTTQTKMATDARRYPAINQQPLETLRAFGDARESLGRSGQDLFS